MKVALFINNLKGGGAEKVTLNLAKWLSKLDLNIEIITCNNERDYEIDDNTKLHCLNSNNLFTISINLFRLIKKENFSVILSTSHLCNAIAVAVCQFIFKMPVIIIIHNNIYQRSKTWSIKTKLWLAFLYKIIVSKADAIVGVSDGVVQGIRKYLPKAKKIKRIYNPCIDENTIKTNSRLDKYKNKSPVCISIGRLDENKNHILQIKAIEQIKKDYPNIYLIICGEGKLHEYLLNEIKNRNLSNNIELVGFINDLNPFYNSADLFLFSSKSEGFGNVLAESLSYGLSVVSTNCPDGPEEILDKGKYGFLSNNNDLDDFIRQVYNALKNPIDKESLIERSREFESIKIANEYLELISQLSKTKT